MYLNAQQAVGELAVLLASFHAFRSDCGSIAKDLAADAQILWTSHNGLMIHV
jgi:hypothetical protein